MSGTKKGRSIRTGSQACILIKERKFSYFTGFYDPKSLYFLEALDLPMHMFNIYLSILSFYLSRSAK